VGGTTGGEDAWKANGIGSPLGVRVVLLAFVALDNIFDLQCGPFAPQSISMLALCVAEKGYYGDLSVWLSVRGLPN
jgi:hypothetical protein